MKFARGSPSRFFESLTVSGLNTRTPERAQAAKLIGRSGRHQLKNLVRLGGCEKRGALAVGIRSSNPGKRQVSLVARVKARVRPAALWGGLCPIPRPYRYYSATLITATVP